ncbi:50S ribosomal protein L17 [Candidatus Microgenomates bacterium]|nr:50S ribosomal protein L17 [Candidatus Microgenomates bacterium]
MRHGYFGNQLGRNTKQSRALYRGLVEHLLDHGRIETTLAKAKAVTGMVDKVIGLAKKNTVNGRRQIAKALGHDKTIAAAQFATRTSGYTRIIRLGQRFSDTTEKVILELVDGKAVVPVVATAPAAPKKKVIRKKKNADKTS